MNSMSSSIAVPLKSEKLPYINFFQYPPPLPATDADQLELRKRIALDEECPDPTYAIFVSIPYCLKRCSSCHFFKAILPMGVDQKFFLDGYLEYLKREFMQYGGALRFARKKCGAIYFGGGTASLLAPDQVGRIIEIASCYFDLERDVEITLEGNPNQFSGQYLAQVKEVGINRVSVGYQSGDIKILETINTSHSVDEGMSAIKAALSGEFRTVNVDLMFGIPGQTEPQWKQELMSVIGHRLTSIKIYPYVVHQGSVSDKLVSSGRLRRPPDSDTLHNWYLWAREFFEREGYVEGRKGSFAKLGHRQRYGAIVYDDGYELIGVGAGSYSFINGIQFAAPSDPEIYKEKLSAEKFPPVSRVSRRASAKDMMRRFTIFSFFSSILDTIEFKQRFGIGFQDVFPSELAGLLSDRLVCCDGSGINLTDLGRKWRRQVFHMFY